MNFYKSNNEVVYNYFVPFLSISQRLFCLFGLTDVQWRYRSWWGFSVLGPIHIPYQHNLQLNVKAQNHNCQPKPDTNMMRLFSAQPNRYTVPAQFETKSEGPIPPLSAQAFFRMAQLCSNLVKAICTVCYCKAISYPIRCVLSNQSQTWNIHTHFFICYPFFPFSQWNSSTILRIIQCLINKY